MHTYTDGDILSCNQGIYGLHHSWKPGRVVPHSPTQARLCPWAQLHATGYNKQQWKSEPVKWHEQKLQSCVQDIILEHPVTMDLL